MNIGIRLHDTSGATLEEHLRAAKAQGFTCAHVALSKTIPGFSMGDAPRLLTPAFAEELRALFEDCGIGIAVLGCYLNLATPDPEAYARNVACYQAHLRFAKWLGARCVGTETGAPNTGYKTEPACFTDEALALIIERLKPVVETAVREDVSLALEPVCRHIVSTPERMSAVLSAYPEEQVQVILDAVNLLNPANCDQAEAIIADSIRRFAGRITVLHMKDYAVVPGKADVKAIAAGTGCMRYGALLRLARERDLPMTLENTVPDNAETARRFLEDYQGE